MADEPRILVVEDDEHMGLMLEDNLSMAGFKVRLVTDGRQALEYFRDQRVDLSLIDIMLPKLDGLGVAREIRRRNPEAPFIFLTARAMTADKIEGFKTGCDDYITKPFELQELIYRIKAVLSRTMKQPQASNEPMQFGQLTLNPAERLLHANGDVTKLSSKEAELLQLFAENLDEVVARGQILTRVWGVDNYFSSKSLDVYLTKIRKYLRLDPSLELENIHGYGYKLKSS